jgi:hypothetical protein
MATSKAKVQVLGSTPHEVGQLTIAGKIHEMARETDEVASRWQKKICKLLRWLGVIQEGSEMSSARTPVAAAQAPRAGMAKGDRDLFFRKKIGGEDLRQQGRQGLGMRRDEEQASPEGELAALFRDLGGA